jgi:ribose-phosphate pyrophosphokinase
VSLVAGLHAGGLAQHIAAARGCGMLDIEMRRFPDGEAYIRLRSPVAGERVWVVAELAHPDEHLLPLLLLASTLREQGAGFVGLVAPYLPYLRQDTAFQPGECVSARHFCALLDRHFDALVTVDAHLHRIERIGQLFSIPATNLGAAPLLARRIAEELSAPLLIGPDQESAQWVSQAAAQIGCPWRVLDKIRHGDREVSIHGDLGSPPAGCTPVLLDDMASTGGTLVEASRQLRRSGWPAPWVAVVHGLFVGDAESRLRAAGVARLLSTDSVPHPSNAVSLAPLLAGALPEA